MMQNTKKERMSVTKLKDISAHLDQISDEIHSIQKAIANFRGDQVNRFDELKRMLHYDHF